MSPAAYEGVMRRLWSDGPVLDRSMMAMTDVLATTPHTMFCVKGVDGTYLAVNQAFADRAGVSGPGDVVGKRAADLFPAELAQRYEAQDRSVLDSGRMLTNELELITRPDGTYGWYVTSKSRWTDSRGRPVGMVCVSVDLRTPADAAAPFARLAAAVEVARTRFAEPLAVRVLADAANMSVNQLERSTRRALGLGPKQLLMRFRLEEALRLLTNTDAPISEIANRCGYYDQSAFTRHFSRVVGQPPSAYRRANRTTPP
jgi:PAS domain S-box-containing protein